MRILFFIHNSLILREKHSLRVYGNKGQGNRGVEKTTCEELDGLFSLPSIILLIKSRIMRCAGHVAHTEEKRDE